MSEWNQRANEIFLAAIELPAEERPTLLTEQCAGDHSLRAQVESLLTAHDEAGSFLAHPLVDTHPSIVSDEIRLDFLLPSEMPGSIGRLGEYEITEVIGRGGMGIVLKAHDVSLNRVVAIKVLAPELAANATARRRFRREARAAAAVTHPHVVTIHAVAEDRLPYLVMEFVDGLTLQERIERDGHLALIEILRISSQIASGLAAAHALGVIHRDIKPANILLENGVERVRITDFGLARAVDDVAESRTGDVSGTPQYMSPEQAQGQKVDARSDLFNLGCVLYAMCTGRSPFRAETTVAAIRRVCDDAPRPIPEVNSETPDWLVQIIDRLLQKDPSHRFETAADVADLLGRHLAHVQDPGSASQPGPLKRHGVRGGRRVRTRIVAVCGLILIMAGLGVTEATGVTHVTKVVTTVLRISTPKETLIVEVDDPTVQVSVEGQGERVTIDNAGIDKLELRPGAYEVQDLRDGAPIRTEMVTVTRDGQEVVRISRQAPIGARLNASSGERPPLGVLDGLDGSAIPPEDRFPWQPKELLAVLGEHRAHVWSPPTCVAVSADNRHAASCGYDANVFLWNAATLELRTVLLGHTAGCWCVAFDSDSRHLLSAGTDNTLRLWDIESGREVQRFEHSSAPISSGALSPDGSRMLSGGSDNSLWLWDVQTGSKLNQFSGHTATVVTVTFSGDGLRALSGSADRTMRLWDVTNGRELQRFTGHTDVCRTVRFLPDGRRAVSCSHDKSVRLWDLETGDELRRFDGHTAQVHCVDVSPDGQRLLSCGYDRTIRLWDVESGEELKRFTVADDGSSFSSVVFAANGRQALASGDAGILRLWDLETGNQIRAPAISPTMPHRRTKIVFSADGRFVLTCMSENVARLWDVASGRQVRQFAMPAGVHAAAFLPDGHRVVCAGRDGLTIFDRESGAEVRRFADAPAISDLSVSHDGQVLTSDERGSQGMMRLWDTKTGLEVLRLQGRSGGADCVAVSGDAGRVLSGGADKRVRLWDFEHSGPTHEWEHSDRTEAVALTADGRFGAAADNDGFVRLYDLQGQAPASRRLPRRHSGDVRALSFSPDGTTLASAGWNGLIVLWDTLSGAPVRQWQLPGRVMGIAFAPDGRHLAIANGNYTVYILRVTAMPDDPRDN